MSANPPSLAVVYFQFRHDDVGTLEPNHQFFFDHTNSDFRDLQRVRLWAKRDKQERASFLTDDSSTVLQVVRGLLATTRNFDITFVQPHVMLPTLGRHGLCNGATTWKARGDF